VSRPLDIHDLPENVVRFHQPHKSHPMGYDVCCGCLRLSELYEEWPMCRWCADSFCPDCQQAGSVIEDEGRETCICRGCVEARTCVECKATDVDTQEIRVERDPNVDERLCRDCAGRRWTLTRDEIEQEA
jgi:hypothetical protein